MTPFLKDIANYLYSRHGGDLESCCMVFPNQRAGLFLKKYLSELIPGPAWSPKVMTITDLMAELSDLTVADDLYLLFELYDIYCKEKKSKESFDSFYFWGEIMLADFDDIDKYLVNASDLFRNIGALRSIENEFKYLTEEQIKTIQRFWQSFQTEKITGNENEFLHIWEILFNVYTRLKERLVEKRLGYEGLIYRNVAERIEQDQILTVSFSRIFFVGFSALNECEIRLFRYFKKHFNASFFWDYDDYYLKDIHHEAGRFMRRNLKEFGNSGEDISHNNLLNGKEIRIISVPSETGQARILPGLLKEFGEPSPETAIILADENMLIPVLHSLPETIEEFNITMGYPVHETPLYSLIGHIIRLQDNCREYEDGSWKFYNKDVLAILNHPSVNHGYEEEFRNIISEIKDQNLIFVSEKWLQEHSAITAFFIKIRDTNAILSYLLNILEEITRRSTGSESGMKELENEILFQMFIRIKRLEEILQETKIEFQATTLFRLIRKMLLNTRIPFSGEPLTGLQVMGVLETRVLDFRNLVLLSMNEGVFPRTPFRHSFIPHNLRFGFNLPVVEHQDAIYSYYFYRLIQRAEKIVLVYNSKSEGLSGGERSRFLHQLVYSKSFTLKEKVIAYNIQANTERPISIQKDQSVRDLLMEYAVDASDAKYLSPSALNMYMDCPLKFYFRFVANIEEPEELKEEVDPLLFGTLLHTAMNDLYKPFGTEVISRDLLKGLLHNRSRIHSSANHAFKEVFRLTGNVNDLIIEGRNVIMHEIIVQYMAAIVERDILYAPFSIVDMEKKVVMKLPVQNESGIFDIQIGGRIDRIDYMADEIRILDYKTGRVFQKVNSINEIFDRDKKDRNSAVFQVMLYSKLSHFLRQGLNIPLVPGLYPVMDINKDDFDYHIFMGPPNKKEIIPDYRPMDAEFTEKLTELVEEIYNTAIPFHPTEITERCEYCPYRNICHR
jgi:CRISPR/Cas system-associated exonuclease Cas4 (RecB family)